MYTIAVQIIGMKQYRMNEKNKQVLFRKGAVPVLTKGGNKLEQSKQIRYAIQRRKCT